MPQQLGATTTVKCAAKPAPILNNSKPIRKTKAVNPTQEKTSSSKPSGENVYMSALIDLHKLS